MVLFGDISERSSSSRVYSDIIYSIPFDSYRYSILFSDMLRSVFLLMQLMSVILGRCLVNTCTSKSWVDREKATRVKAV